MKFDSYYRLKMLCKTFGAVETGDNGHLDYAHSSIFNIDGGIMEDRFSGVVLYSEGNDVVETYTLLYSENGIFFENDRDERRDLKENIYNLNIEDMVRVLSGYYETGVKFKRRLGHG
jgi:hypothetical protein